MTFTTLGSSFLGAIDGTDRFLQQQKAEQDLKLNALKLDAERRKATIELQAAQDAPNLARWVTAPAVPPGQASVPMGVPPQPYSPTAASAQSVPVPTLPPGQAPMPMGGPPQPYKSVVASAQPTPVNTAQTYSGPPALSQQPPRVTLAGMVKALQDNGVPEDHWLPAMEKLLPFMDREDAYRAAEIKSRMEQQFHEDTVSMQLAQMRLTERNQANQYDIQNRQLSSNEANQRRQVDETEWRDRANEAYRNRQADENKRHHLVDEDIKKALHQNQPMSPEDLNSVDVLAKRAASDFNVNRKAFDEDVLGFNRGQPLQGVGKSKDMQRYLALVKDAAAIINPYADRDVNRANYTAISKSLTDREKYSNIIDQFSGNLKKQIELVKKYLNAGVWGNTPLVNEMAQKVRAKVFGSEDVSNLGNLINTLRDEHQKIVTGSTGTAGLTVSAQETAKILLNVNMTPSQIQGVLKTMQEEAANADENAKTVVEGLRRKLDAIGRPEGNPTSDDVPRSPDGKAAYTFPDNDAGFKAFKDAKLPPGTEVRIGNEMWIVTATGVKPK